ncbi:hypothetical protein DFH94DRAFT_691147 [Russula ochroleuca]|uniref:Uncharacterized protein n=1 Tax=Russula ochroleuca TaxID=152965 RepID=A0A9P5N092_9AGAM|nr:hypothetical protein DFH94DRAFT_691147 [Russula ochroleuca]
MAEPTEEEASSLNQQSTSGPSKREDDDMDESNEDDTKTGYVLVLNNNAIDMESIWVRADYIRIYDFLMNHYNRHTTRRKKSPSAVDAPQARQHA